MEHIEALAEKLVKLLGQRQLKIATAESCTGGWVAQAITAIAGSSKVFDRGFVTYSNAAKCEMLGVPAGLIANQGAVSIPTACAMAEGALKHSAADTSLAITGIAGPTGGVAEKPVGTVCFAWAGRVLATTVSKSQFFTGDRHKVRQQAVSYALQEMLALILNMEMK